MCILLDSPLEYKKGESQTNMVFSKEGDWGRAQDIEEEQVKALVNHILEFKPDLVITRRVFGYTAQHLLVKHNVSALRCVRKFDNNRIALAVGMTIVNHVKDLREADVGTQYFSFLTERRTPKACSILLRGPSKDILNEIDRNLVDAMSVARNIVLNPMLAPGGGATEMAISVGLQAKARSIVGVEGWPYRAVADAMEVIPRTLVQNSGGNVIRVLTELRIQTFKTAIEAARMLLRVDNVVQAVQKDKEQGGGPTLDEMMEAQ
ncbi:chaperonin Cpn60/TCP-1 family [Mycena rosella]|uniref:Chaperonin Cpn60/TCP-1 family n=1 Tax=Mycena rosella TaxID=1033263 RepID=A0AAD7DJ29_MYCRO|nr:chaperonin Cpn60/TCP-1 family [Mycena rosella]